MSANPREVVSRALGKSVADLKPMPGGNIGKSWRGRLDSGRKIFAKFYPDNAAQLVAAEVASLEAIAETKTIRTPEILASTDEVLVLEWIDAREPTKLSLQRLGHRLGALHRTSSTLFGFSIDNYIGDTPQPNDWEGNGAQFYRIKRFGHMLELLRSKGTLPPEEGPIDALIARLEEFLPNDTPSLIHGDLWAGNVLVSREERPYLVDPATYYGYREADLAMSQLFGGFDKAFYAAYHEAYPIDPAGYKERKDLFNLYHLLNHAYIFGGGYLQRAIETARHYVG